MVLTGSDSRQKGQAALHQVPCPMGGVTFLCRGTQLQSPTRGMYVCHLKW